MQLLLKENKIIKQDNKYKIEKEREENIENQLKNKKSTMEIIDLTYENVLKEIALEISDEDIETAFTRIERNELKSELIELEEAFPVSESELNEKGTEGTLEDELNNNQIKEEDDRNDFEWF